MSAQTEGMKGPRLEYVVREQRGKVKRPVHSFDKKAGKIVTTVKDVEAGYIIYMPPGLSYRLTREELLKRGFDRQPTILNFESVNDTKTNVGKYKFAMDDATRRAAWRAMEDEVIKSCIRKHGPVGGTGDVNDQNAA